MLTDRLNVLKTLVELIKQLLIVVAIGAVLIAAIYIAIRYPAQIIEYLKDRKVSEINLGVVKLTLEKTEEAASDSNQIIADLIGRLRDNPTADRSRIIADLEKLQKQSEEAVAQVQKARSEVTPSTSIPEPSGTSSEKWGVIFGSYPTAANTDTELTKAKELGAGDAKLYLNKGRYRGVLEFNSEAKAKEALKKIETAFKSAYVRNLNEWCGTDTPETTDVVTC